MYEESYYLNKYDLPKPIKRKIILECWELWFLMMLRALDHVKLAVVLTKCLFKLAETNLL